MDGALSFKGKGSLLPGGLVAGSPHAASPHYRGPFAGAAPPDCCKFVTSSNAISPLIAALGAELQGYKLQDKLKSLSLQGQWEKLIIFMGPDRAWAIRVPQPWSCHIGATRCSPFQGYLARASQGGPAAAGQPLTPPPEVSVNGNVDLLLSLPWEEWVELGAEWPVGPSVTLKDIQQSFSPPIAHRSLYYKYINHNVSTKAKFNFLLSAVIWAGWYMAGCARLIYYTH